jgi:phosphate transport system permease protein
MRPFSLFEFFERMERWVAQLGRGGLALLVKLMTITIILLALAWLGYLFWIGQARLNTEFLFGFNSVVARKAGVYPALMGSLWLLLMVFLLSFPPGLAIAVHLERGRTNRRIKHLISLNLSNLAGIPSVVYGLAGLEIFARQLNLGVCLMSAALTLALMALPTVIITCREAIRRVPAELEDGAVALGATPLQALWFQTLPTALPGILSGVMLSISRVVGEAAPLLVLGAVAFVPYAPSSVWDYFTLLPVQIFYWSNQSQPDFAPNAAAAVVILLGITLIFHLFALWIRNRWKERIHL